MNNFFKYKNRKWINDIELKIAFALIEKGDMDSAKSILENILDDEELDVAVFCLSLMGKNFTDYLKEEHRTLSLWIKLSY